MNIFFKNKNLFFTPIVALVACTITKKTLTNSHDDAKNLSFIDNINLAPGGFANDSGNGRYKNEMTFVLKENKKSSTVTIAKNDDNNKAPLTNSGIKIKYEAIFGLPAKQLPDKNLLKEIDDWMGVPYLWGGDSKLGIDCSAFTARMVKTLYKLNLPRTATNQYNESSRIKKTDIKEGDLIFFHTTGRGLVTHVGLYVINNKFVHASTSRGVMVSDLDDIYWKSHIVGYGRIRK